MAVKGLTPQLAERGKLKIGEKGETKTSSQGKQFSQPRRLDHFVITTMQRDAAGRLIPDTTLMARLKPEGGKITEIPVRLLYDDPHLNFLTRYACYRGTRCWCSGDGETAQRLTNETGVYQTVPCPCERQDPLYTGQDRCKILGTLQVLIEGTDRIGGVWKFRTTSWNTVNAILSSMALIKTITGGPLAGIPLYLVLSPKTVTVPTTGQNLVVYVVSLEYRGTEEALAELGYQIARRRVEHQIKMEQIEAEARRLLLPPQAEPPEEQAETAQEFYPEGAAQEPGPEGHEPSEPDAAPFPQDHQAITFTALMDLVHKQGHGIATPLAIRSHRHPTVLAVVERAYADEGGKPVLEVAFAANLKELSQGLTPEEVTRVFGEAGIEIKAVPPEQSEETVNLTELPDQGNGVLRVEIAPEGQPAPPPKGRKHLKPVDAAQDKPSLF